MTAAGAATPPSSGSATRRGRPFSWRALFSLPLLTKELTETAARRRTYVLRVVFAVLLYGLFALSVPKFFWAGTNATTAMLGAGRQLFELLLYLELGAIALFLPALMCGRITEEKERDSLVLLFLTELRPWQIVLQKYLGGLVPMATFLLLGVPLGAVAYSLGGLGLRDLIMGVWVLALACLQLGALALACSAWCRTTVTAFVQTYLLAIALYFVPILLPESPGLGLSWQTRQLIAAQFNPFMLLSHLRNEPPLALSITRYDALLAVLVPSAGLLVSIALLLVIARVGLVRRAFAPPGNWFRRAFRWLDAVMVRGNRRLGNVTVLRARDALPAHAPISWRETTRTGLGQPHHLVRVLLVLEVVVGGVWFLAVLDESARSNGTFTMFTILAWIVVALFLSVQSANALVSERVQQSLDVLLTTPMSAARIVVEKAHALRRLALVLGIPLLTLGLAELISESRDFTGFQRQIYGISRDSAAAYAVCVVLSVLIYLPLFSWLALWIGLRARTRFRAIATAVGVLAGWCGGVPLLIALCLEKLHLTGGDSIFNYLYLLSPGCILVLNEESRLRDFGPQFVSVWPVIAVNFLFYFHLLLFIRSLALARADHYLRR